MAGAVFASCVAEPLFTSLGGGGFLLYFSSNKKSGVYDFFVDMPDIKNKNALDFTVAKFNFKNTVQNFYIGLGSVAIPGTLKGILMFHRENGILPLKEIMKPAIKYAKNGIFLGEKQIEFMSFMNKPFSYSKKVKKLYTRGSKPISSKDIFKNISYANFLKKLQKKGDSIFYAKNVGTRLEKMSKKLGGALTKDNLKSYRVYKRDPIKISFKEYTILTNPNPSSGGILISFALKLLENLDFGNFGSIKHITNLVESFALAHEFRKQTVEKNIYNKDLKDTLVDKKIMASYKQKNQSKINIWGNTTHISILDQFGNATSLTNTNGECSGYVAPKTGILLNNMLGEEDLSPSGFFNNPKHKRLSSMMAPTIVLKDEKPYLIVGSAGSNRIRDAIVQVIINVLIFKKEIQNSIDLPRIHYENGNVYAEPGFNKVLYNKIRKMYNIVKFKEKSLFFGGVQAVGCDFKAGADPRRDRGIVQL